MNSFVIDQLGYNLGVTSVCTARAEFVVTPSGNSSSLHGPERPSCKGWIPGEAASGEKEYDSVPLHHHLNQAAGGAKEAEHLLSWDFCLH